MRPVILYRPPDGLDQREENAARKYFPVLRQRTDVKPGDIVIGRYSVLPFYRELDADLLKLGAHGLINPPSMHEFVADVGQWSTLLHEVTPQTWSRLEDLPDDGTSFVVKGQTNSRKDRWNTHMFALTKSHAIETTLRLQEDSLIQNQRIYYRRYEPLKLFGTALNGMPVTEEYRFFVLAGQILTGAYYWSSHLEIVPAKALKPQPKHYGIVEYAIKRLSRADKLPEFVVFDVATKADGEPVLIELNDGQMSGLSETDPDELYRKMSERLADL